MSSTKLDLSHLCIENSRFPANTYIGILLALRSEKSFLWLHWFTELYSSALAAGFMPSSTKVDLSWLIMATKATLLHLHLAKRPDNSTNHLNMESRNIQFIFIFYGWEMFQPNLKSKLLQPFSIATLLLKHKLFLQLGLFFPEPRRMYYLPITKIILLSIFVPLR